MDVDELIFVRDVYFRSDVGYGIWAWWVCSSWPSVTSCWRCGCYTPSVRAVPCHHSPDHRPRLCTSNPWSPAPPATSRPYHRLLPWTHDLDAGTPPGSSRCSTRFWSEIRSSTFHRGIGIVLIFKSTSAVHKCYGHETR